MENYIQFKLMGGKIILKPDVVPHIFDCQKHRKRVGSLPDRSLPTKRERKRLVDEAIAETEKKKLPEKVGEPCTSSAGMNLVPDNGSLKATDASLTTEDTSFVPVAALDLSEKLLQTRSVGVQVRPSFRSKYISCNLTRPVQDSTTSPLKYLQKCSSTSPMKKHPAVKSAAFSQFSSSSDTEFESSSYVASTSGSEYSIDLPQDHKDQLRTFNVTCSLIENKPKYYTGIPDHWFPHIITLLSRKTNISKDNLMLTLLKIKLNDPFVRLGDMFGMSTPNASKIFKKSLPKIAQHLKTLIFWPSHQKIKYNLPIPFRARYSNVQSIIDCLEIEIQKPTEPIKQALTWSEYKKCNTLKYLISSSPDGFINFISKGYGGRISDSLLVQESGYLNVVPTGCSVMADRGFKDIAKQLHEKNCILVRPPSVSSTVKPTKGEVLESKRIASLRIHIERVIRRLREFEYLKPHSVIDHSLIGNTDLVIEIACALINLQNPIVKQK